MIYEFIDDKGGFQVKNPHKYNIYFPLCDKDGYLLSSISPNLGGDIKRNNNQFLTPPASIEDLRNNLLCRRDFFIKINNGAKDKNIIRLSYPYNDTLEAGFLYHKLIKETEFLHIEVLSFIPYDIPVEVMQIKVINKSSENLEITPTSFIPLYGRGEKNLRDHRHVSSLLNRVYLNKYGITLKPTLFFDEAGHSINKTAYFVLGYEDDKKHPLGQFPTLDYFCGQGDLIFPQAIEDDIKPANKNNKEFDGKENIAAFRFNNKKLKPNEEVNYFIIMGIDSDADEKSVKAIPGIFGKLDSPDKINQSFQSTKEYWNQYLANINIDFNNKDFNNWLLWVKIQPTLRKLFGCSFLPHFDYGKGGRGWRDLWQDSLTLLLTEPKMAKKLILNNFQGVRVDGSNATIITKEGDLISDRNKISRVWMDHGVWPYLTLRLYINKTGDLNILNQNVCYFSDHLFKRAKEINSKVSQKDNLLRAKNKGIYKGTVLEHILIQNITAFFNVGNHNIIKLENADWNDGLDMAADKGESVAFTNMYAHNLKDLCFFLKNLKAKSSTVCIMKELLILLDQTNANTKVNYNNYKEKQNKLEEYFEITKQITGDKENIKIDDLIFDLEKKSEHLFEWLRKKEWLNQGFFNGYYDNKGKRVEGVFKGKIRIMLTSQVFAIMSGTATDSQIKKTWQSIKKYLKDNKLGGFRLNTDFVTIYQDMGRAFAFSYGDKENGAFFNHMIVMLSNALYKRGFIKEGFEVINSIYMMSTDDKSQSYPIIPEYFNNSGRGLYLYLTGSASWYIYTIVEEVLGVKFVLGDLLIEPKLIPLNFSTNEIKISWPFEGKKVILFYILKNKNKKKHNEPLVVDKVFLEGEPVFVQSPGCLIKRQIIKRIKQQEINIIVHLG